MSNEPAHPAPRLPAEDRFLSELAQKRTKVAIFLINGIKLEAEITAYDKYVIMINGSSGGIVYKHTISTIQPMTAHTLHVSHGERSAPRPTSHKPIVERRKVPMRRRIMPS